METILFSDIESSTRLWEEHPNEMASSLARHDSILTTAMTRAGGTVLKTTGDGMIAGFESAADSVAAALDAQRVLAIEPWGATGPLRVRMGIHAGDTESRNGDHFGPSMNRTARIMAAGHGGQVLVSGIAADQADGSLPEGASLRDLGVHRLKDLTLPEHLYQLVHADLQTEFPAPLTLDSRPHNLPLQSTEFLGRANELTAIGAMLETPNIRLLTITGPGGAGKTRLGLQVAAQQFHRFDDGVFFVDLSQEHDPDAAFEAVVRALELPSSGGGPALGVLKTRLRDREMLLLLDNFEQVTSAAPGITELLQSAPRLKAVITSRETLRVRGEYVFPVPPLSLPDPNGPLEEILDSEAAQLFVERAQAVDPAFHATIDNAPTIAEICLRLDGLPLAIELAAARLNVFTPSELLSRLRERLDVLGAGGRDVPDRQRTLWGAIGWSYELLDEDERDLFDLMAVFSTATMTAIEAVASAALGAFDVDSLASLVDKSLLQADDAGPFRRFGMLLMIKEYAAERLAQDPESERHAREAHAVYFSDFVRKLDDRLNGDDRDAALGELATEIGNLRTAWRYWVQRAEVEQLFNLIDGLWALHDSRGWYHAAIELASDTLGVLAATPSTPELATEELMIRTSLARALLAVRGYGVEVEDAFRSILELLDDTGSTAQRFPVLRSLFFYHMNKADFEPAYEIGKELLEMAEHDESIRVDAEYIYGASACFVGRLQEGLGHLDRAIELHDPHAGGGRYRLGTNVGVAARVSSGLLLWQCGALDRAIERIGDALDLARRIEHPFSIAWALYHNGFLALARYRFEECIGLATELAQVSEENDYLLWRTLATVLEGVSTTAAGDVETGLAMTEAAIELYQGLTAPPVFWPLILNMRAVVFSIAGRPERGMEMIDEAIEVAGNQPISPPFWVTKGDLHRSMPMPDLGRAESAYLTAAQMARSGGLDLIELQALTRLVTLRRETGTSPDGSEELATLYSTFTEGFDEYDLVTARAVLGVS